MWKTAFNVVQTLIGNLVESVKGQMNHETEVFTQIAEARAKIGNGSVDFKRKSGLKGELRSANTIYFNRKLSRAQEQSNVEQLMTELAGSENASLQPCKDYNSWQQNTIKIKKFPTVLSLSW